MGPVSPSGFDMRRSFVPYGTPTLFSCFQVWLPSRQCALWTLHFFASPAPRSKWKFSEQYLLICERTYNSPMKFLLFTSLSLSFLILEMKGSDLSLA